MENLKGDDPYKSLPVQNSPSLLVIMAIFLDNYIRGAPESNQGPNPVRQCMQTTDAMHGTVVRVFHHITYPIAFMCAFLYHVIRFAKDRQTVPSYPPSSE